MPVQAISRAALALAATLAAPLAQAAEVWFSGGFTSFQGPVATGAGQLATAVHTEVNGITVHADHALPDGEFVFANYGLGLKEAYSLLDAGGAPVAAVAFDHVFFSSPNPNLIQFTPSAPQQLQPGQSFSIGTFSLTNGAWFGNAPGTNFFPDTDLGFSVTTHSTDPALDGHSFAGTLRFVVTSGASTDEADADYFYFVERSDLGSLRVYEAGNTLGLGNTGSIDLSVRIGSLIPVELNHATGAAFVGANPVAQTVPEPTTVALWLGGLGGLALRRRSAR
ncbi:MAG TPA: choice-of-anchor K domain-containing protein [Roseateles sp.]